MPKETDTRRKIIITITENHLIYIFSFVFFFVHYILTSIILFSLSLMMTSRVEYYLYILICMCVHGCVYVCTTTWLYNLCGKLYINEWSGERRRRQRRRRQQRGKPENCTPPRSNVLTQNDVPDSSNTSNSSSRSSSNARYRCSRTEIDGKMITFCVTCSSCEEKCIRTIVLDLDFLYSKIMNRIICQEVSTNPFGLVLGTGLCIHSYIHQSCLSLYMIVAGLVDASFM